LIIGGEDDFVSPVDQQREMAALIPHSNIVILPDCGHLAHWEKPAEFGELLSSFVSQSGT
jgi:pimeloyl-ACP methyl ester carboxylesterase